MSSETLHVYLNEVFVSSLTLTLSSLRDGEPSWIDEALGERVPAPGPESANVQLCHAVQERFAMPGLTGPRVAGPRSRALSKSMWKSSSRKLQSYERFSSAKLRNA